MEAIVWIIFIAVIWIGAFASFAVRTRKNMEEENNVPPIQKRPDRPQKETVRSDSLSRDQRRARLAEARDRRLTERSMQADREREARDQAERSAQARRASEAAMKQVLEEQKEAAEESKRREGERQRNQERAQRQSEADAHDATRQQIYQDRIDNEEKLTAGARAREAADPNYAATEAAHEEDAAGSMDLVYDLITCGYDPKKMGQRDFLAEGQDMIEAYCWK